MTAPRTSAMVQLSVYHFNFSHPIDISNFSKESTLMVVLAYHSPDGGVYESLTWEY